MSDPKMFSPILWEDDTLKLLDQTRLQAEEVWIDCTSPAIGVTAAYVLVGGWDTRLMMRSTCA